MGAKVSKKEQEATSYRQLSPVVRVETSRVRVRGIRTDNNRIALLLRVLAAQEEERRRTSTDDTKETPAVWQFLVPMRISLLLLLLLCKDAVYCSLLTDILNSLQQIIFLERPVIRYLYNPSLRDTPQPFSPSFTDQEISKAYTNPS